MGRGRHFRFEIDTSTGAQVAVLQMVVKVSWITRLYTLQRSASGAFLPLRRQDWSEDIANGTASRTVRYSFYVSCFSIYQFILQTDRT